MRIPTFNKCIKSNQNKPIMEINALKVSLVYLLIIMWSDKLVTTVLVCYTKALPICGISETKINQLMSKPASTLSFTQIQFLFKYCSVAGGRWCMYLSLTCYLSEISKWFDVHFAISKFSKGMILKLHLVFQSDVCNVWT